MPTLKEVGTVNSKLKVDFSSEFKSLVESALDRLPYSFIKSCVLRQFISVLANESELWYNECIRMQEQRTIYNAQGAVLDALGRIVGQGRQALTYYDSRWFWFDRKSQPWDVTSFWAKYASLQGYRVYTDEEFRKRIVLRIGKNFVKFASVPEVTQFVKMATGQEVSFIKTGPMEVTIVVPSTLTRDNYGLLVDSINTLRCDDVFAVPYPVTLKLSGVVIYVPSNPLIFDRAEPYCFDIGHWAVRTSLIVTSEIMEKSNGDSTEK